MERVVAGARDGTSGDSTGGETAAQLPLGFGAVVEVEGALGE